MNIRLFIVLASAALCGCDHYPKTLQPEEQIHAVVFERLASDRLGYKVSGDSLRLFLSVTDGRNGPDSDPSPGVFAYMKSLFPSTRHINEAQPVSMAHAKAIERSTGQPGLILRVSPVTVSGDGPITVRASYYYDGTGSEGFEYQLRRENGKWVIVGKKMLWVS